MNGGQINERRKKFKCSYTMHLYSYETPSINMRSLSSVVTLEKKKMKSTQKEFPSLHPCVHLCSSCCVIVFNKRTRFLTHTYIYMSTRIYKDLPASKRNSCNLYIHIHTLQTTNDGSETKPKIAQQGKPPKRKGKGYHSRASCSSPKPASP